MHQSHPCRCRRDEHFGEPIFTFYLRRALSVARESVEDDSSSEPSRELLLYCWGFCVALTGHHQSEDVSLFPKILQARPDLAPVIAKLIQDHSMIGYLVGGLEHALKGGTPKDETLRHLDGIEAVMETHFGYEERQLIEVLNAADGLGLGLDRTTILGPLV